MLVLLGNNSVCQRRFISSFGKAMCVRQQVGVGGFWHNECARRSVYKIGQSGSGQLFNTLRPRQDGRHFPDDIFQMDFLE